MGEKVGGQLAPASKLAPASVRPLLDEVEERKKGQDEHRVDQPPLRDQQSRAALAAEGCQAARGERE